MLGALLPTMSTGPEPEREAAAKSIESITGTPWPRAVPTGPAGAEVQTAGGARLTSPSLESLAPSITPVSQLVRPPAHVDYLKGQLLQKLPPQQQLETAFPAGPTREERAREFWLKYQQTTDEKEKDRLLKQYTTDQHNQVMVAIAQMHNAGLQQHRDFVQMMMQERLDEQKRRGASAEEMKETTQFLALQNQLSLAQGDQKKVIQTQLNAMIDNSKSPMIKMFPKYTEPEKIPGTGWFGTNIGAKTKETPVGTKTTEAETEPTGSLTPADALKKKGYTQDASGNWVAPQVAPQ
jgi:hypothetical protein